jgi:predicted SAM-dependent methyltransferase
MEEVLVDLARCEKLEPVDAAVPYTRRTLRDLGVTGIEFAAWKTQHPTGLGSDLVSLRAADGTGTEPGRLYLVDGERHFVGLDICRSLPIETGSVDWVYAEHLIEHVPLDAAIGWLTEVRRILAPGGLLRLTTPDLARYVAGYADGDGFFARHRRRLRAAGLPPMPARRAFMFNQMFYLYGHRWIYDLDELRYALGEAGFDPESVRRCAFREGARPDVADLDRVLRSDETMYAEATIPLR